MLAQLSARLMASRAAGAQPGNHGLLTHLEAAAGPEGEPARLALGDDCSVM